MATFKPIQKIEITTGKTYTIDLTSPVEVYYVYGSVKLASSVEIVGSGTPYEGLRARFEYKATLTPAGNTITFLGTAMPSDYASKKVNIDCYYNGSDWVVDYVPAFDESDVITSSMIKSIDGNKLDSATVPLTKLVTTTASRALETSAGGVVQASTTTTTELGYLAGTTPGTIAANKAVVPTTGKVIDEIDITTLKKGGVSVTATGAELNTLAGVTAGTGAASKALVLDGSSKITTGVAEFNTTVLKINSVAVAASAAELNQLNGAGVLKADFDELEDLAANGVVKADLALLAGLDAAGVTNAAIIDMCNPLDSPGKVQTKTDVIITDATVDENTGLVITTLSANTNITLPDGSTNSKQVIDFLILDNPTSTYDITFLDTGATFYYAGTSASNSITVSSPAPGAIIKVSNYDTNKWAIGM